ncbi:IclR family transcriptional regulator C-terminal domain-containing protein [Streptomyces sp. NPDC047097]|uniref:IclR family transcriptional regulator domain-containing protein n=1 Tax=Streptomyces sp. NPDC047097 TaxID=3155260 RepID=UPI0033C4AF4A
MTGVSRFNQDDGGPGTALPAELRELRRQLAGEPDFWDRPEGYAVPAEPGSPGPSAADQQEANSWYRLGTRALRRNELAAAAGWLGEAAEAGHPGALFRLAVVALRAGGDGGDGGDWAAEVAFLVAEAARHGHGDARRLLAATEPPGRAGDRSSGPSEEPPGRAGDRGRAPSEEPRVPAGDRSRAPSEEPPGRAGDRSSGPSEEPRVPAGDRSSGPSEEPPGRAGDRRGAPSREAVQDVEFHDEVRTGLAAGRPLAARPLASNTPPGPGRGRRLALVPAPQQPPPAAHRPSPPTAAPRPLLRAVGSDRKGGPVPAPPAPSPYLAMVAAGAVAAARADAVTQDGGAPRWSPNVLRPAHLTDLSRDRVALPAEPPVWQTHALRARDLLLHIQQADGISTRDLARRTRMSLSAASWLVDWLTRQFFVETVEGAHRPGAVLEMATDGGTQDRLMQHTLDMLRDRLGAAVYLSTYTDGEIALARSSHSGSAPPVRIGVPFADAGHASAVGKALLADLDPRARLEHLARHRPVSLTSRTITDPGALFDALDRHGPRAVQFDLLEYSPHNVCAALSLTLPGHDTACVALSLPADDHERLLRAATALSQASTGLLVTQLLHTAACEGTGTAEGAEPGAAEPLEAIARR